MISYVYSLEDTPQFALSPIWHYEMTLVINYTSKIESSEFFSLHVFRPKISRSGVAFN